MSAATFVCPHCGHLYPVKPALVGKAVRCTACRNAFILGPDGVAQKVVPPPVATAAPAPAPIPAPAPAPAAAPVSPLAPPTPSNARMSPPTPKAVLTEQQQAARKAMAESLRASVNAAMQAESLPGEDDALFPAEGAAKAPATTGKADGPQRKTESQRKSRTNAFAKTPTDPKKAGKGPAILTGEGEREAANTRQWWLALVAFILVVAGIGYLATRTNERLAAVLAFTSELPLKDLAYGRRDQAILARAWTPTITPFIDLGSPVIGAAHEIPDATLAEQLRPLDGLVYVPAARRWIAPAKVEWLTRQLAEDPASLAQRLAKAGVVVVERAALHKSLINALGDEAAEVVEALLVSPLGAKLQHPAAIPLIRWCEVHGKQGQYLQDVGQAYQMPTAPWRGLLVSITGPEFAPGWRFLTLGVQPATP
jgi:hypothetical protein